VRHLTPGFALGALRRGATIEQFLGPVFKNGVWGVRWIEIRPQPTGFEIVLYEVADIGLDYPDFERSPLVDVGEEYFGDVVGVAGDETEALAMAARHGTLDHRWVNQFVVREEYADFINAGRPGREA
jgi:hypothetical protein